MNKKNSAVVGDTLEKHSQMGDVWRRFRRNKLAVFGMCIGYPDHSKLPGTKPRLPLEAIVHEEEYSETKKEKHIEEYDRTMLDYYRNRPQAARDESWSAYVSKVYEKPKRMHLKGFLENRKFGLK